MAYLESMKRAEARRSGQLADPESERLRLEEQRAKQNQVFASQEQELSQPAPVRSAVEEQTRTTDYSASQREAEQQERQRQQQQQSGGTDPVNTLSQLYVADKIFGGGGGAAATAAPASLGMAEQFGNIASGAPMNSVGTAANGGYLMADGSTLAANSAESMLSAAAPYVGGALGAYGLYELSKDWGAGKRDAGSILKSTGQGAASGAAVGNMVGGAVGAAVGGVLGGIYGAASTIIHSGKHDDQKDRDGGRSALRGLGLVNEDWGITLADGSTWDLGVDGGKRLQADGTTRRPYEVNFDNPLSGLAVGLVNPLAEVLMGGKDKLRSDFAGYFANAAVSNAKSEEEVIANIKAFYSKLGVDSAGMLEGVEKLKAAGQITEDEYQAYRNSVTRVLGNPQGSGGGSLPAFGGFNISLPAAPKPGPVAPMGPPDSNTMALLKDPGKGVDGAMIFQSALRSMLGERTAA